MKKRRRSLYEMYSDLRENGSTSDFPNLLADVQHKILLRAFKGFPSPWAQFVRIGNLSDFKPHNRVTLGEAPDLVEVPQNGHYKDDWKPGEQNYQIQLGTYGRTWNVTRQTIINDDLNGLSDVPTKFGRASARTIAKQIVARIEANGASYDGNPLFTAAHGNTGNTALTADAAGITAVNAAVTAMKGATDPDSGELMGVIPWGMLVPRNLEMIAKWIVRATTTVPVSTSGGPVGLNPITDLVANLPGGVIVEPLLTNANKWYLIANPADFHFMEVGFLNGNRNPDLLVKAATARRLGGGDDRWDYDFDDISFKIRHDWAIAAAFYQAIYLGNANPA